jgi:hypothetical protein
MTKFKHIIRPSTLPAVLLSPRDEAPAITAPAPHRATDTFPLGGFS